MWLHFSLCFHGKSKVCKVIFTQGLKGISWLVFYVYLLLGMGFFDLKKYHLKKNGITGKSCSYFAEKNSDFCRTASFLRENDDRIRGFLDVQFFFA